MRDLISGIGSILHFADKNTIVWGSGSVWYNSVPIIQPKQILAVRGKMTKLNLKSKGYKCPDIFGDPGLLIKKYTDSTINNIPKNFKLGLIPHFSEKKSSVLREFLKHPEIKVIDIENVDNLVTDLLSCEKIASSALHGLVFSDAFQIPNVWISFSNKIFGGNYKFLDYYSSIYRGEITNIKPFEIYSIDQYPQILKMTSIKSIDLDVDLLEYQLINYYNSI